MRKNRTKPLLLLVCLLLLALLTDFLKPVSLAAAGLPEAIHNLRINLVPENHLLEAEDLLSKRLSETEKSSREMVLELNENLEVQAVVEMQSLKELSWKLEKPPNGKGKGRARLQLSLPDEAIAQGTLRITIKYTGQIYDPVGTARDLSFVRGDVTSGIIGLEGTYLSSASLWFPSQPRQMALFHLEVMIPEPFKIVTQGRLLSRASRDGLDITSWQAEAPSDELTLVAGQYTVSSQLQDGILISTYFSRENQEKSPIFLQATADYLIFYSPILGPYPYSRFDIVENFFSSGYGFPAFTLLGPEVIRMGERAIQPGYLDHEIVHSWWGNFVYHEPESGNWAEGLTSYLANYLYKEKRQGPAEARKHRRDISLKYSIRVKEDRDYPLSQFRGKEEDFENDIGYGKASMVFHQIRRILGDEKFFQGLREIIKNFGGKRATWKDFQMVWEELSGRNLGYFFAQWLHFPGGPGLSLEDIDLQVTSEGYLIKGVVSQTSPFYRIPDLTLAIDSGYISREYFIEIAGEKTTFQILSREFPLSLKLDPDYHLFRRLWPEEIIPGLNAALEEDSKLILVTDSLSEKAYSRLAEMISARKGGKIIRVSGYQNGEIVGLIDTETLSKNTLVILGKLQPEALALFKEIGRGLPPEVTIRDDSIEIKGRKYSGEDISVLLSFRHPVNPARFISWYFGFSPEALSRSRNLFYYGWDSYLVFREGRPIARGDFLPKASPVDYSFALNLSQGIKAAALMEHVRRLASPEMEGRYPGTAGLQLAETYVTGKFHEAKLDPVAFEGTFLPLPSFGEKGRSGGIERFSFFQPFSIVVKDTRKSRLVLKVEEEKIEIKEVYPLRFSRPSSFSLELVEAGYGLHLAGTDDFQGVDIRNKAVLILDGVPPDFDRQNFSEEEILIHKLQTAQGRGARALIILSGEESVVVSPYLSFPSRLSPLINKKLAEMDEKGTLSTIDLALTKLLHLREDFLSRVFISIPVFFVLRPGTTPYPPPESKNWLRNFLADVSAIRKTTSEEIDFYLEGELEFSEKRIPTGNILGFLPGPEVNGGKGLIILGAHLDHLGRDGRGQIFPGANDNASGVAVLLEIARNLSQRRHLLQRSLLFVAFGAEEWGLLGSHHLVRNLLPTSPVQTMLNIDSIGGGQGDTVFLIGSSLYPLLHRLNAKFLPALGLSEGQNIDHYAYRFGSDHYPFHLGGVPAMTYFSGGYRQLHQLTDTPGDIDAGTLEKVARLVFLAALELASRPDR